jgi:hypothetical protein
MIQSCCKTAEGTILGYRPKAIVVLTERTRSLIGACLRKGGIGAITHTRAMGVMGVRGAMGVKATRGSSARCSGTRGALGSYR